MRPGRGPARSTPALQPWRPKHTGAAAITRRTSSVGGTLRSGLLRGSWGLSSKLVSELYFRPCGNGESGRKRGGPLGKSLLSDKDSPFHSIWLSPSEDRVGMTRQAVPSAGTHNPRAARAPRPSFRPARASARWLPSSDRGRQVRAAAFGCLREKRGFDEGSGESVALGCATCLWRWIERVCVHTCADMVVRVRGVCVCEKDSVAREVSLRLVPYKDGGTQSTPKQHFRVLSRDQMLSCQLFEAGPDCCVLW